MTDNKTNSQKAINNLTKKGYITDKTVSWVTQNDPVLAEKIVEIQDSTEIPEVLIDNWIPEYRKFQTIGYDINDFAIIEKNQINYQSLDNDIAYSKSKLDTWSPGDTFNDFNLKYAPKVDTSNIENMEGMYSSSGSLGTVPQLDTNKVTNMHRMFSDCGKLLTVPQFDTSLVNNMSETFSGCSSLTSVPQFDTSSVNNMSSMFNKCSSLTSVPQFDTSSVNNMSGMFYACSKLTTIPQFDTSNVTNMNQMFDGSSYGMGITSIPQLDTSNVTDMGRMFYNCKSLVEVPELDASKVTNITHIFGENVNEGYDTALKNVGGFIGLKIDLDIAGCNALTKESLINIMTEAAFIPETDRPKTLKFGSTNLAKLSEEDKKIAKDKGWTLE